MIANFFKHLGLIDQCGNGLKLIADELKHHSDIELKWHESGMQFQVQFVKMNYEAEMKRMANEQATPHVTTQVVSLLNVMESELSRREIQEKLALTNREYFKNIFLQPALKQGLIEMTQPNSPKSPTQKYRLTQKGIAFLKQI